MASPQLENGYIKIVNEIMEKLCSYRLSGEEWQILCVLFRKIYGWGKTQDQISLGQFAEMTGLPRPTVARAIRKLLSKKILGVIKNDNTNNAHINTYVILKDYDNWQVLSKKITVPSGVIKKDNQVLSKMIHTKETITKEKKDSSKQVKPHVLSSDYTLTDKLIAYARSHGLQNGQIETEFEKFKNYFLATGRKYVDWDHAFYNWVLRAKDSKPKGKQDDFYRNWKVQ